MKQRWGTRSLCAGCATLVLVACCGPAPKPRADRRPRIQHLCLNLGSFGARPEPARMMVLAAVDTLLRPVSLKARQCPPAEMFFRPTLHVDGARGPKGQLAFRLRLTRGLTPFGRVATGPTVALSFHRLLTVIVEAAARVGGTDIRERLRKEARRPLWPGSRTTRSRLLASQLAGLYWMADRSLLADAGELSDYLQVFYILWQSAALPAFRGLGRTLGLRAVKRYSAVLKPVTERSAVEEIFDAAAGLYLVRRFGGRHPKLFKALDKVLRAVPAAKLLRLDQKSEGGPAERILDALVDLYFLDRLKLPSPRPYLEVVRQASSWPLKAPCAMTPKAFDQQSYLVTHYIYVMSDFDLCRLSPTHFGPQETYIRRHLNRYMKEQDVETVGEFGDCLKILGYGHNDPAVRRIVTALMKWQNADGSWGPEGRSADSYDAYHSTWTAFNGLLEYRFQRNGPCRPELRKLVEGIK